MNKKILVKTLGIMFIPGYSIIMQLRREFNERNFKESNN